MGLFYYLFTAAPNTVRRYLGTHVTKKMREQNRHPHSH